MALGDRGCDQVQQLAREAAAAAAADAAAAAVSTVATAGFASVVDAAGVAAAPLSTATLADAVGGAVARWPAAQSSRAAAAVVVRLGLPVVPAEKLHEKWLQAPPTMNDATFELVDAVQSISRQA